MKRQIKPTTTGVIMVGRMRIVRMSPAWRGPIEKQLYQPEHKAQAVRRRSANHRHPERRMEERIKPQYSAEIVYSNKLPRRPRTQIPVMEGQREE